ncbi:MAG: Na+:solute symporter [Bacteroidales bacterium]|nr:Na+:solute symporter [Bacteroidales bacterium]
MHIEIIDWGIIALYFIISISIGIYMSKRAGRSTSDFFLTGRNLPWYVAGTSMVATTFAADTPLAVTELVSQKGIAGNWLWWNMLFGGMLTVFFFARLWRRSDILTDTEFVSIRYSGRPAHFLRGFRAVYIGIFMNVIVMAWVNLAMVKILQVMFPDLTVFGVHEVQLLGINFSSHLLVVGLLMIFVAVYSSLSGLWGVSITDTFQFVVAMGGSITLAVLAVKHIGGMDGLKSNLSDVKWVFDFIPDVGKDTAASSMGLLKMSVTALVAYLGVQWWASWYPGAEPGGGGYVAQRMMSAKDEKHSLFATLWFQVAHYALRPWPWILVALVALVLYPNEPDKGATYVMVIRDLLPSGLLGLLLAAFFAAYMSTIASQTVWGTSYIINDFFRPFIKPGAQEKYYVTISRITTFVLIFFSIIVTTQFDRISDAWKFILACSGGIGLVLMLRWFWWRINVWSEIAAMVAPYLAFPALKYGLGYDVIAEDFEISLIIIVAWSTFVWLLVTFLTKPTEQNKLEEFYKKVHPGGIGWKPVADKLPQVKGDTGFVTLFVNYICGCLLVMFTLFGFGKILFKDYLNGALFLVVALIAGAIIYRNLSRTGWDIVVK